MANRYSKVNVQNKTNKDESHSDLQKYESKQKRIDNGAKIMAIVVIAAMLVTTFLGAGFFLLD